MEKFLLVVFALALPFIATGCASVTGSPNQSVSVQTREQAGVQVVGASCELTNDEGKWFVTTPGSVSIPPRQNSCRLDIILNLGAIRKNDGTIRRSIQEQGGGAFVAAGERQCGFGGERNWSDGANTGTMA